MTPPRCEVIGCKAIAAFVRVEGVLGKAEDFLCTDCYEQVAELVPDCSACYMLLDEYMPLLAVLIDKQAVLEKSA